MDFENQISVSHGYLSRCKKKSNPTLDKILKIVNVLDIELCFCDKDDFTRVKSDGEFKNSSTEVKCFEISSSKDLVEFLVSLDIEQKEIEYASDIVQEVITEYQNGSREPSLKILLKLADSLGLKLCFIDSKDLTEKDSYLELSQMLIDSGVITPDPLIDSIHTVISDLKNYFSSDKVSNEQKEALESKIKDLLYEETKKLL